MNLKFTQPNATWKNFEFIFETFWCVDSCGWRWQCTQFGVRMGGRWDWTEGGLANCLYRRRCLPWSQERLTFFLFPLYFSRWRLTGFQIGRYQTKPGSWCYVFGNETNLTENGDWYLILTRLYHLIGRSIIKMCTPSIDHLDHVLLRLLGSILCIILDSLAFRFITMLAI